MRAYAESAVYQAEHYTLAFAGDTEEAVVSRFTEKMYRNALNRDYGHGHR